MFGKPWSRQAANVFGQNAMTTVAINTDNFTPGSGGIILAAVPLTPKKGGLYIASCNYNAFSTADETAAGIFLNVDILQGVGVTGGDQSQTVGGMRIAKAASPILPVGSLGPTIVVGNTGEPATPGGVFTATFACQFRAPAPLSGHPPILTFFLSDSNGNQLTSGTFNAGVVEIG